MVETRKETVAFFSGDETPPVQRGGMETFIVTVEWHNQPGRYFTFAAYYLNQYRLEYEEGCKREGCKNCEDDPGDGCPSTGWFELKLHQYYDAAYFPLLGANDRVIEWASLPGPPK